MAPSYGDLVSMLAPCYHKNDLSQHYSLSLLRNYANPNLEVSFVENYYCLVTESSLEKESPFRGLGRLRD